MMTTGELYQLAQDAARKAAQLALRNPHDLQVEDVSRRASKLAHELWLQMDAERVPAMVREFNRDVARAEARDAAERRADAWVTGCGGDEEPMRRNGGWVLYQYNPARGEYRYLDLETLQAERC